MNLTLFTGIYRLFSQASVILFTGGVCIPACTVADTLRADTPLGQTSQGRHPPGRHPPGQRHPPGRHPPGRHPPGRHPPRQTPQQTATAADSTHPTGMHSCYRDLFYSRKLSGNKDKKERSSLFVSNYQGYHKTGIPIGGQPTGKEFRREPCYCMYWSYDLSYCVMLGVGGAPIKFLDLSNFFNTTMNHTLQQGSK